MEDLRPKLFSRGVRSPSEETGYAHAISPQSERIRKSVGVGLYSGSRVVMLSVSSVCHVTDVVRTDSMGSGGGLSVFLTLIVLQRFGKLPNTSLEFMFSSSHNRRDDGAADYEPRIAGQSRSSSAVGTNQPITAKEAHEMKVTSANTWVPTKSGRNRKK